MHKNMIPIRYKLMIIRRKKNSQLLILISVRTLEAVSRLRLQMYTKFKVFFD